jgi:hypothetical protein
MRGVDDPEEREYWPTIVLLLGMLAVIGGGTLEVKRVLYAHTIFHVGLFVTLAGIAWNGWRDLHAPGAPLDPHNRACLRRRQLLAERETARFIQEAEKLGARNAKEAK